jgi:hypothetical protein
MTCRFMSFNLYLTADDRITKNRENNYQHSLSQTWFVALSHHALVILIFADLQLKHIGRKMFILLNISV